MGRYIRVRATPWRTIAVTPIEERRAATAAPWAGRIFVFWKGVTAER
jgi:hypothetical protein